MKIYESQEKRKALFCHLIEKGLRNNFCISIPYTKVRESGSYKKNIYKPEFAGGQGGVRVKNK